MLKLEAKDGPSDFGKKHDKLLFRAQLFYFMGEVEAVFGIWLIPLFVAITAFHCWATMVEYVGNVNVAHAIFVRDGRCFRARALMFSGRYTYMYTLR